MSKYYLARVNSNSQADLQKLENFIATTFTDDRYSCYILDAYEVYSGDICTTDQTMDAEDLAAHKQRITALSDKFDPELVDKIGAHSLVGATPELKAKSIVEYIASGLCQYIALFGGEQDADGSAEHTLQVQINGGWDGDAGEDPDFVEI
ncbi:MAG: hypothetical protein K0R18_352 [Bacillales bacterium]|jgi:hypothetical protein|nr:hypothetical protein [Bacillales bacterium]